jgi:hypothetical protein
MTFGKCNPMLRNLGAEVYRQLSVMGPQEITTDVISQSAQKILAEWQDSYLRDLLQGKRELSDDCRM